MNFFTVVLGVLFALFAWNNPEVATVIVVAVVVVWVALWIIGQFLEGYNATTTSESEYRELMESLSRARHDLGE